MNTKAERKIKAPTAKPETGKDERADAKRAARAALKRAVIAGLRRRFYL